MINRFGANTKRIPKIKSLFELLSEAIGDTTLLFLLVLGTVNAGIGIYQEKSAKGAIDGIAIYAAVAIIVGI
jgi:hypothetical protein